jgi:hypothetical protein
MKSHARIGLAMLIILCPLSSISVYYYENPTWTGILEKVMHRSRQILLLIILLLVACGTPASPVAPTGIPTSTPTTAPLPTSTAAELPTPEVVLVVDDFEAGQTLWQAGGEPQFSDSSALSVTLTSKHASQGAQALELAFAQDERPKAIFYLDLPLDFSQGRTLQFDLFQEGTAAGVGFAVTTGVDAVWYESDIFPLKTGMTTVTFDLTAANYKAASTNWEFRTAITGLNNISRLAIIIFPTSSGSAYLDNVNLIGE